ncbi:tRNA (adenosine(37)-N6)-dimethylallyltransferase MiaA [Chelativorans sp. M5D2P16]|uniref:tRNA (adenosine(37)-N6)-dimethylallyltransferase MiaA n=1 Tax=Chelativorans sp. M5D2P16 TaxID=3095678 RepID=UPI002ACABD7E|nr:tRNA (adenosine(37)-N6)-dimethylallyltransferase MiaA [Chelativorans sp. M5D2P16]MDZ5698209.1 tRNA (adenosine(37)-N6)-dimethylallyltransferase MiaA [Chelativorans sp. M5D2P16]
MERSAAAGWKTVLKNATLIAGPTASGKSSMALNLARQTGGVIVNADSMQVYSVLRLLTARPGPEELAAAPHRLYGHVHPSRDYSTGQWLRDVEALVEAEDLAGSQMIFVGGTGLYFRALTEGLSPMPDIPPQVRRAWRARLAEEGSAALHAILARTDPESAERIRPSDGQRIVRALEVLEASGEAIAWWQARRSTPLVEAASARKFVLEPDRPGLAEKIDRRFARMLEEGALEEVRALLGLDLPADKPAMKAIGVRELADVLAGRAGVAEAAAHVGTATRRYAKRQMTWFRHQLGPDWERLPA